MKSLIAKILIASFLFTFSCPASEASSHHGDSVSDHAFHAHDTLGDDHGLGKGLKDCCQELDMYAALDTRSFIYDQGFSKMLDISGTTSKLESDHVLRFLKINKNTGPPLASRVKQFKLTVIRLV